MSKITNKLTTFGIASLKTKPKHYLVSDGGGLNLKVYPNGRKQWLLRKSSNGKALTIPLGDFPAMSLASARAKAAEVSASYIDGRKHQEPKAMLFADIVDQWLTTKDVRSSTLELIHTQIKPLAIFNDRPLNSITPLEARAAVSHYLEAGKIISARYTLMRLAQIERHGMALGLTDAARLQYVSRTLPKHNTTHHRSVTAERLPEVFERLKTGLVYTSHIPDLVKVICLTLCRVNEAVALRYDWIDFDAKVIEIPASQMKGKRVHRVPITSQLEAILKRRQSLGGVFVFPSRTAKNGHKSGDLKSGAALMLEIITPHGFRSMGRSWMAVQGYDFAASEYCLAHKVENATQAAYQRYDYLEQRRIIMQAWCDYVQSCYDPYYPEQ